MPQPPCEGRAKVEMNQKPGAVPDRNEQPDSILQRATQEAGPRPSVHPLKNLLDGTGEAGESTIFPVRTGDGSNGNDVVGDFSWFVPRESGQNH